MVAGVRRANELWPVETCEAAAAVFGLVLAGHLGYQCVHLKEDALNVIRNVVDPKAGASPIILFYESIAIFKEQFSKFSCTLSYLR